MTTKDSVVHMMSLIRVGITVHSLRMKSQAATQHHVVQRREETGSSTSTGYMGTEYMFERDRAFCDSIGHDRKGLF